MRKPMFNQTDRNKYNCQKSKAKQRSIEFTLTFDEWWSIWEQSGKYELRGHRKGQYVMSRYNDVGPYAIGNVFIQSCEDNHRQVQLSDEVRAVMRSKRLGKTESDITRERKRIAMMGKNIGKGRYYKKELV
jgi:hypothetical protein